MPLTIKEFIIVRKRLIKAHKYFKKIDAKCDDARKEYVYCIQKSYKVNHKTYINAQKHYEKISDEQRRAYIDLMKAYNKYMVSISKIEVD